MCVVEVLGNSDKFIGGMSEKKPCRRAESADILSSGARDSMLFNKAYNIG